MPSETKMSDNAKATYLAEQVVESPQRYPLQLVQCAMMLLFEPESVEMQASFLELYHNASLLQGILVGKGLPFPPDKGDYYQPGELGKQGVEIGVEPLHGWTLKPSQLLFSGFATCSSVVASLESHLMSRRLPKLSSAPWSDMSRGLVCRDATLIARTAPS